MLAAEKAIEISPSFALGYLVLGMGRLFRGNAHDAIGAFEHGLMLYPYDPQNFVWHNLLALAYLFADRAEDGLAAAVKGRRFARRGGRSTRHLRAVTSRSAGRKKRDRASIRCANSRLRTVGWNR